MIRLLESADTHQLLPMAQEHAREWRKIEVREGWFRWWVNNVLIANDRGVPIGYFDGDRLVATAAGFLAEELFSGRLTLYGLWWYVAPEARGSTVALRVLRELFREAKDRGGERVEMGVQVQGNERVARIYARMGLEMDCASFSGDFKCLQR